MARGTTWTNDQRDAALDIYTHSGPRAASRATGVPATTISRWAQQAGIASRATEKTQARDDGRRRAWVERRGEIIDQLGDLVDALIRKTAEKVEAGDLKEARYGALAAAIAVDKAQLLSGGATERVDWSALPAEERAARLTAARDDLAQVVDLQSRKVVGQ